MLLSATRKRWGSSEPSTCGIQVTCPLKTVPDLAVLRKHNTSLDRLARRSYSSRIVLELFAACADSSPVTSVPTMFKLLVQAVCLCWNSGECTAGSHQWRMSLEGRRDFDIDISQDLA